MRHTHADAMAHPGGSQALAPVTERSLRPFLEGIPTLTVEELHFQIRQAEELLTARPQAQEHTRQTLESEVARLRREIAATNGNKAAKSLAERASAELAQHTGAIREEERELVRQIRVARRGVAAASEYVVEAQQRKCQAEMVRAKEQFLRRAVAEKQEAWEAAVLELNEVAACMQRLQREQSDLRAQMDARDPETDRIRRTHVEARELIAEQAALQQELEESQGEHRMQQLLNTGRVGDPVAIEALARRIVDVEEDGEDIELRARERLVVLRGALEARCRSLHELDQMQAEAKDWVRNVGACMADCQNRQFWFKQRCAENERELLRTRDSISNLLDQMRALRQGPWEPADGEAERLAHRLYGAELQSLQERRRIVQELLSERTARQ